MPVFNDSNNIPALLPEGDYIFCVVGFEIGIQANGVTRGSEKYEVELEIEPSGKKVPEVLIDHAKTAWKIDCFLKAAGVQLAKGQAFEFREDAAKAKGVLWVNPVGLRGWCRLTQEELPKREGYDKPMTVNKVAVFYTDKPKLERRKEVADVSEIEKPF